MSSGRTVDELWLEALQRIAGRAAHEIKGALNGVAVNLEVVRSRAAKADAPAASVASFATVAAEQLEAVVDMTDAVLVLARAPREPVDVAVTVKRLAALLRPAARAEGHQLEVVNGGSSAAVGAGATLTSGEAPWTRGNTVRLAVASALLAGLDRKCDVRCELGSAGQREGSGVVVGIEYAGADAGPLALDASVVEAVSQTGVRVGTTEKGISLAFPS